LSPQNTLLQNHAWLYNLTGHIELSANATKTTLQDLNTELQAACKMALQNRVALDLLLLQGHGVCGCLTLNDKYCCVHIPNTTEHLEDQLDKIK